MAVDTYGKRVGAGNFQPGSRLFTGGDLNRAFQKMLQGGLSRQDGLTAHAGGTQAAALQITTSLARFSTVATAADSAALPKAIAGSAVFVRNDGANSMNLYAKVGSGDTINGASTTTAYALAAGKSAWFICLTGGAYVTLLSA